VKKIVDGFFLAVSMLTILPFFKVHHFYKGINGYSVMFYPLVGFMLGGGLYGIYNILLPFLGSTQSAMVVFGLWVVVSGGLHLDGFGDTIDGLFVSKDRALRVMKDPHMGGMGIIFTVVFLMLKASALVGMEALYLLPVILLLSRYVAVVAIFMFDYINPSGMGSLAKSELTFGEFVIASLFVVFVVSFFNVWSLLLITLGSVAVCGYSFSRRYGGFNGDMYGFSIELTELFLLYGVMVGVE
jgi:cobalamin synthase